MRVFWTHEQPAADVEDRRKARCHEAPPLAFQAWPDYLSCGDFADLFKEHCHEHDLPKNACIIDVCFGDA